jgi:ribose transport system substrate-binding protein
MRKILLNMVAVLSFLAVVLVLIYGKKLTTGFYHNKTKVEGRKVIAVSTIGATHGWPVGVLYHANDEVQQVAKENDWDYICLVAKDSNEQSRQIIGLVEQKVDCIIMLPMDGASLKTAAKTVQDAGIPLVVFDREIPDFAPTATVKGDNAGIGITTAKIFNNYFLKGTKVLEFMGDTSTVPQQRTDGYDDIINDNFAKEQVGYTGWQRSEARVLFEAWVEKHSQKEIDEVGAIFTHDDEIALGILDALDAYEVNKDFKKTFKNLKVIAGSAGPQEMYRRILSEDKYYLFSLTYRGAMIREAIGVGEKIMKGENYHEMTILSTFEVNKTNAKEYLDEDSPY